MKKQFTYLFLLITFFASPFGFANDVDFYVAENVIINVNINEVSNVDFSKFKNIEITEIFVKENTVLENIDEIENAKLVYESLLTQESGTKSKIKSNKYYQAIPPSGVRELVFPFSSKNVLSEFTTFLFVPTSSTKQLKTIASATLIVNQNTNLFDGTKRHAIISTKLNTKNLQNICIYSLFSRPPTV